MPEAQFVIVSKAESGQKLLQFLERRVTGDVPKSAIQRWIRKGEVRVDKGRKKPFDRVLEGQTVRIPPYTPGQGDTAVSEGRLVIAYEDDALIAVAKPAGLAAHGGDKIDDSVTARLNGLYPDAEFRPTLAHRLDRETSGLLVVAKTYGSLRELNELFASGGVGKVYLAWVDGRWSEPDGTLLMDEMEKSGAPGREKVRTGSGKTALAKVSALVTSRDRSLVAVRLLTGRTHQIRVQLASRGFPVVGDRKYGPATARGTMRLHCFALQLGERTLTLPPAWSGAWEVPADALQEAVTLLYD